MALSQQTTRVLRATSTDTISTEYISVKAIRWVGATTAGHVCTLTDTAGNIVWTGVADAANYTDTMYMHDRFLGLIVSAISSGVVYIYLL